MKRNKNGWMDLLNGKRAGFGRIFGMEIGDNVGSMYWVPTWKYGKQGGSHTWSQADGESRIEDLLG